MRTRLLLLCFCVVPTLYGIAQPNNNCSNAIPITNLDGTCLTGNDIAGATEDIGPGACTVGSNNNVWFSFVADGVSAEITVSNGIGVPEITLVEFPNTPCDPGDASEIACVAGSTLTVDNQLVIGSVYYIMVASSVDATGFFDICVDNPEPAPNDACITAQNVSTLDGTCIQYDNDFPATDVLIPSCFTGSTYNVWFSFTAVGVSLDVNIPAGGPGVAQFAVIDFTGANCNITGAVELGCATGTNHVILDNLLTIGTQYHVVVGFQNSDFNGNGIGDFELCIDNPIPAPNDECGDAFVIPVSVLNEPDDCVTQIGGNDLNNDFPSTDIGLFPCWNAGDSYNIWYSFVAQGPDVEIEVDPVFNADAQIALVEYNGNPCEFAGANLLACANNEILDYNDQLIPGQTYYIAVGFEGNAVGDFCMTVFDPLPPPNDLQCDAIPLTDSNCEDGTTIFANPEGFPVPPDCQSAITNTVWYTMQLSDPDNVGFEIQLELDDVDPQTTVSAILYADVVDCDQPGNIVFFYCGDPPTEPILWGPVDENVTYYLMIGTSEPFETGFEVCMNEVPPCFQNDICEEATLIPDVISDAAFVCIPGCNLFADPETTYANGCQIQDFSTVWFQIPTDGVATLMNIQVTSDEFDAPTISLYQQVTDCSDLQPIGLTQSNFACVVGSNGEAEALATDVGSSEIYYLAVSSLNNVGGNFEVCVNTISVASACVVDREIEITSRSFGGPLEGPFLPGETIGVCMNVNSYTASGNGCQWFQGLVPVFGNGWDPSSFDANGQPIGATVNGNPIGQAGNGVYANSTFDWFTDAGYHHDNVFFQIGDIDGNGTVDMCNILYDPDCPDFGGINGWCCGPCWDTPPPGDVLPPGWFAYGINGTCPIPGPPAAVDWGDGNTCGCCMGPWEFCFDLIVRPYPECLEDNTTMDLSLGFFTFADGEVGSWTGGASVCALDQPAKITLPMCCTELESDEEELDPICSGFQFVYVIDRPGVDFWQWTVEPTTVTGGMDGSGAPGTVIINTLVNAGSDAETVVYTFLGFAGGACPVYELEVSIVVFPEIQVVLEPLIMCATPTMPYTISPVVTGGSGNYEYAWTPGGESTSSISVPNPVNGTQYCVLVNDDVGCARESCMTISVYTTFPVDILAPITEQCLQDGEIDLEATATDGTDPYSFVWTFPDNTMETGDAISSDQTGEHLVVVTDDEGCVGADSVILTLNESPEVFIDALNDQLAICPGEATQLTGVASGGETPYVYYWDTPDGPNEGKTIDAETAGIYSVTVEDGNGCTAVNDLEIEEQDSPQPNLGPDILVCNFEQPVELTLDDQYEDYTWSIGPSGDGEESIEVYAEGLYEVTVTNEFGCTGQDDVNVDLYDLPQFPLPDTFEICEGGSIIIDADEYGGPWDIFDWEQCPNCFNEFEVTQGGDYQVTVFDDNGCSAYQEFAVTETASLNPGLTGPTVICSGNTITLSALSGFDYYEWAPGNQNTQSITVSAPGTYSVHVEDDLGCAGDDTIVVTSGDFVAAITGPNAICAGVQATLNAGGPYTNYAWSNLANTQIIQVEEGTYSVTVTNAVGCVSSASITIIETPFVPVITGNDSICQTSETTTLDAGGPYASYVWSANTGGNTLQTYTTSVPGLYSVTITDLATCVGTASFTVSNHAVPFVAITGNPDFCVGGNTQMSATGGYVNYLWNTTEGTSTITINTAGNYIVTITDTNGCTNTANTTVNPPYQETVEITGSLTFCPGDQATLEVPSGYASVLWSTGETTDQITTSIEGSFSVTVVDADGCIATDTETTDENSTLSPTISGDTAICDAGSAVLNAGTGFDNYVWSNGLGTNQFATVNAPGNYSVTVSSDSGCVGEDDFDVAGYTTPTATVTPTATACNVQEPGGPSTSLNFNTLATGAAGQWLQVSGPSSVNLSNLNNVNFNGLAAGTYTFSYTTSTAVVPCYDVPYTMIVTVSDCACPALDLAPAPDLCNDLGTISLNTIILPQSEQGGTWTIISAPPGSNSAVIIGDIFDATNADNGLYTVQYAVSGLPNYCASTSTATINVLNTPTAGIAATPLQFCAGESQSVNLASLINGEDPGGIWVETSQTLSTGGAFNPATGQFNTAGQIPGIYHFDYILVGPGPCPDDVVTVEVVIENNPVADAGNTATLDCTTPTVVIGGSGSSVGSEFEYSWVASNGGVVTPDDVLYPTASAGGTYTLTVLNTITGCSATDVVTIDQIGAFPSDIDIKVQSPDCEGDPAGSATVIAVVGGTPPYSYSLNNGASVSSGVFAGLATGDYSLEVTDASGCQLTETFTIEDLVVVDLSIVNYVNDTLIFDLGDTIKLSYIYEGTNDIPDSVVWKLGDSVLCINCDVLEIAAYLSGQITLEAYDVRGCRITKAISFLVVRERDVYIPNIFSPNGDDLNDYFTLFTDADLKEISLMEVYTRWGDLVFRKTHFQPNDPSEGWDGRFRGETLNPGVYVYRIEIEYGDGLKENLAGDVTILR